MKINQLFKKRVEDEVVDEVLACFGLSSLDDRRMFCKHDFAHQQTIERLQALVPMLQEYYLPCKAKVYLDVITPNRAITILKQFVKLHEHTLLSREKNINNHKVIFYQLQNKHDLNVQHNMVKKSGTALVEFT